MKQYLWMIRRRFVDDMAQCGGKNPPTLGLVKISTLQSLPGFPAGLLAAVENGAPRLVADAWCQAPKPFLLFRTVAKAKKNLISVFTAESVMFVSIWLDKSL
jgi:hypothetical protein